MKELPARQVTITDPLWHARQEVNALRAIDHQWNELEKSGCIDNFRIVSGEKEGFREGWFFADSDAFKWLDAAARVYAAYPGAKLKAKIDELIRLVAKTQTPDGYIYTYNQFHFPGQRWVNLQIEHELYCHGHFIEGAVSHYEATGETTALDLAIRAADLLVRDFLGGPPERTEGHEEVEIGLLKLYQVTGRESYLDLAQHFIEVRGRVPNFGLLIFRENSSREARAAQIKKMRAEYATTHPEYAVTKIPPDNEAKVPPFAKQRWMLNAFSGKYSQQHAPVREQTVPVGHSVRYAYFQTATTMLQRLRGDASLMPALEQSWERMVTRRMYVTGGIGSLPGNEGFGNDYELDPEYAYAETCAALGSLFWNWEMALATREAKYSDLFEWQLYNAAAVGMGLGGDTYLYNNPLTVRGGIKRRNWYSVPCCPSNLSRTWAYLGKYIYSFDGNDAWIHQYIGSKTTLGTDAPLGVEMESGLPFNGSVTIRLDPPEAKEFTLHLRIPSWAGEVQLASSPSQGEGRGEGLNQSIRSLETSDSENTEPTAQGYNPCLARFESITRTWSPDDVIELTFEMPIIARYAHPKVKGHAGKAAITRGPLVYCLESVDNPGVDIFSTQLDPSSLRAEQSGELGGITLLRGKSAAGETLTFIPYHLWGNRGESQMTVWVNLGASHQTTG